MFVPSNWWHAVLNLDMTVAITQNFCNYGNFDRVWIRTRKGRKKLSVKFLELLNQHKDTLAHMITAEHGKVFTDAQGEVTRGIEIVEFATGIPQLLKTGFTDQVSTGIDNWVLRQPLGVVAGITPFNFPAMVPMWMFANAIACGNTFVLKPSEKVPLTAIKIAKLLEKAGLPKGVLNIVHGGREVVDALLTHPDEAYRADITAAIIDALLDHGRGVAVAPEEWLTVAARRSDDRPPTIGAETSARTVVLRLRGADLADFLAGRLTREQARRSVVVQEY